MKTKYLSVSRDTKTIKGEKNGVLTGILYLSPYNISGVNLCPFSTEGCRNSCLYVSGNSMRFPKVNEYRLNKTQKFLSNKEEFLNSLYTDILILKAKANKLCMEAAVRLNGTSDINWQILKCNGKTLFEHFPDVHFYDYTKNFNAMSMFPNYDLTYSRGEEISLDKIADKINNNKNVSVVFLSVPKTWNGFEVIDGDINDSRFNDKKGVIVGLKAKAKARKDSTGFVVI